VVGQGGVPRQTPSLSFDFAPDTREWHLKFSTERGMEYRLKRGESPRPEAWIPVGEPIFGDGAGREIKLDGSSEDPLFLRLEAR